MDQIQTGAALLAAILDDPGDDLRRLIFADWLEETGQGERASSIRYALWVSRANRNDPSDPVEPAYWSDDHNHYLEHGLLCGSDRGFISSVSCPLAAWLEHGPAVAKAHPLESVRLCDREPSSHYRPTLGDWYWVCQHGDTGHISDRLPPEMYAALPRPGAGEDYDGVMTYSSREEAVAALSKACVVSARKSVS